MAVEGVLGGNEKRGKIGLIDIDRDAWGLYIVMKHNLRDGY